MSNVDHKEVAAFYQRLKQNNLNDMDIFKIRIVFEWLDYRYHKNIEEMKKNGQ